MKLLHNLKSKFKDKEFIQNTVVNLLGDITLIILGLLLGYFLKCMFI